MGSITLEEMIMLAEVAGLEVTMESITGRKTILVNADI